MGLNMQQGILQFVTVVETGSFTKAAEKLNSSKARISQQISQLESNLGVTLLHRSTRNIRLSDIGEQFYNECSAAIQILNSAEETAREARQNLTGKLRINSVGGIFGEQFLAPAILEFMQQYPDIQVELSFNSEHVDLMSEPYDLVLRVGQLQDSSLIARRLINMRSYLVASPDYIKQKGMPDSPEQLKEHTFITGSVNRLSFIDKTDATRSEVVMRGILNVTNGHIHKAAALKGLGVTRLSEFYIADEFDNGSLVEVMPNYELPPQPISLLYLQSRYKMRRVQVFIDHLLQWFESYRQQQ